MTSVLENRDGSNRVGLKGPCVGYGLFCISLHFWTLGKSSLGGGRKSAT